MNLRSARSKAEKMLAVALKAQLGSSFDDFDIRPSGAAGAIAPPYGVVILDELEPIAPDVYRTESGKVRIISANDDLEEHDRRRDAVGTALQNLRDGLDDATLDCRIYGLFVTRCSDLPEDNRLVDAFQLAMGLSG